MIEGGTATGIIFSKNLTLVHNSSMFSINDKGYGPHTIYAIPHV